MPVFARLWSTVVDYHHGGYTPTVILWTLGGMLGLIITLFNLRDASADARALAVRRLNVSEARRIELVAVAKAAMVNEVLRTIKMLTIVAIGVVVAFTAPTLTDMQRRMLHIPYWTPTGVALTVALLTIVGITVLQAWLDRRLRHRFYNRILGS